MPRERDFNQEHAKCYGTFIGSSEPQDLRQVSYGEEVQHMFHIVPVLPTILIVVCLPGPCLDPVFEETRVVENEWTSVWDFHVWHSIYEPMSIDS